MTARAELVRPPPPHGIIQSLPLIPDTADRLQARVPLLDPDQGRGSRHSLSVDELSDASTQDCAPSVADLDFPPACCWGIIEGEARITDVTPSKARRGCVTSER